MTSPHLTVTDLQAPADPTRLVVLTPGLGTDLASTWASVVPELPKSWRVIGVDLPGHGESAPWTDAPLEPLMSDLACSVVEAVLRTMDEQPHLRGLPVHFAGISLAGGLALQLAQDHSATFTSVACVCSGPRFGTPEAWLERAEIVRLRGTAELREGSLSRWFSAETLIERPEEVDAMLRSLTETDEESYALLCEVLADFDLSEHLETLGSPVLVLSGAQDSVSPPEAGRLVSEAVLGARQHVIPGVAHQAPMEAPEEVADQLRAFFEPAQSSSRR